MLLRKTFLLLEIVVVFLTSHMKSISWIFHQSNCKKRIYAEKWISMGILATDTIATGYFNLKIHQ